MKIAATYDNGNIFQHFGRTENFKVYDIEDGKVVSSQVIGSNGIGHGALAGLLADNTIDVLICGGLGGGAMNALTQAGITVIAGAQGSADEAVDAYLRGELVSSGANCDHHHHHGEGEACCGHHDEDEDGEGCCGRHGEGDEEGCSSNESCCGGGCGAGPQILLEGKNAGKNVKVHYRGTFNDGTQF
ncbi:MAG: peptidylprolyl isomerase, partial [Lachnospiraceae bacterium]|nr:peptidylprolyl isomerase [Lachnospiraceae bacterium]